MIDRSDTPERTDYETLVSRISSFERECERLNRELSRVKHDAGREGRGTFAFRKLHRDMRTLLSRIMRFTEMVRDGMAGPVTEAQREYLGEMYNSGQKLHRMINDLTRSLEPAQRQD
jgi:signal transduction histidine kinase